VEDRVSNQNRRSPRLSTQPAAFMKSILALLTLAFPLTAFCADEFQFAIVSGVETFQRVRSESNLYPWDHAGPDEIIVSNACGFARVEYYRVTTPGFSKVLDERNLKSWKALVQLGEWCKIGEFILDDLTLVAYREWKGKIYLIHSAELFVGENDRLYVDDTQFIEETGLKSLLRTDDDTRDRIYVDAIPMQTNKSLQPTRGKPIQPEGKRSGP
jgi:hypothetical protein